MKYSVLSISRLALFYFVFSSLSLPVYILILAALYMLALFLPASAACSVLACLRSMLCSSLPPLPTMF